MGIFPNKIKITEVGPRDGLQNISTWVPTEKKIEIIDRIIETGINGVEVTSFVKSTLVPQFSDGDYVANFIASKYADRNVLLDSLVPNPAGAKRAVKCGIKRATYVISASEKHNLANVNRTIKQSLAELKIIRNELPELEINLGLPTSFGCPYLGDVSEEMVMRLVQAGLDLEVSRISLCDTIGTAKPDRVYELSSKVLDKAGRNMIRLHFHRTRDAGIENIIAGMKAGIMEYDAAFGGLGGCPFAPGATGNIATEDLLRLCGKEGIDTDINVIKYNEAADFVKNTLQSLGINYGLNFSTPENK